MRRINAAAPGTWRLMESGESVVEKRIPVLVVSGFLGAGKTTLVRHLLQGAQRTGVRVAVVSNEFGALGIDKALLGEGEAAYVELAGGCVCCQLSDTLLDTLQMLCCVPPRLHLSQVRQAYLDWVLREEYCYCWYMSRVSMLTFQLCRLGTGDLPQPTQLNFFTHPTYQ